MLKVNNLIGLGTLFEEAGSPPGTGITVEGFSTPTTAGSATSITHSFTCPGTADFLIGMFSYVGATSNPISSVTWAGNNMTQAVVIQTDAFNFTFIGTAIYYITAPTTGSQNFVANFSASQTNMYAHVIACKNVAQMSPLDVTGSAFTDSGGTVSKTVGTTTTVANSIRAGARILHFGSNVASGYTPGTNVTETADIAFASNNGRFFGGYHIADVSGLFNFECSGTSGNFAIADAMAVAAFKSV